MASRSEIKLTCDLDGVVYMAQLPPISTLVNLLLRKDLLADSPNDSSIYPEFISQLSILAHSLRLHNPQTQRALQQFSAHATRYHRRLTMAALSGREPDKHSLTRKQLNRDGYMNLFSDLYLNPGTKAHTWKRQKVSELLSSGYSVVHLEDDLRAGLSVAHIYTDYSIQPRVLVYLLRNISNHPALLRHASVDLPSNLIPVNNPTEAAKNFEQRLIQQKF